MTTPQRPIRPAAGTYERRGSAITARQLLAVDRAMSGKGDDERWSLLLDSVVSVLLEASPLTESEIGIRVLETWPGANLSTTDVLKAAELGVRVGELAPQTSLDGEPGYTIAGDVATNTERYGRVDALLSETREAVRSRCEELHERAMSDEEATYFTDVLVSALSAGIREAFEVFNGQVANSAHDDALLPAYWDGEAMEKELEDAALNDSDRGLLSALALAAVDPSSRFGSNIVSRIATGYVLHAFVARRDRADDMAETGPIAMNEVYLDTPFLLHLSFGQSDPLRRNLVGLVKTALEANLRVTIPEECKDEFQRLLFGLNGSHELEAIRRSLAEGSDPYVLRNTVDHTVFKAWLSHAENRTGGTGKAISWEQYCTRATSMFEHLKGLGVTERAAPSDDSTRRMQRPLRNTMLRVLEERPRTGQREDGPRLDAVRVDVETMTLAHLARRNSSHRFWPGAWVLTPDTRMAEAYRRHFDTEEWPVAIQPSTLAALLSRFVTPANARQLAAAAATLLSHETLLRVASFYPADVAATLASLIRDDSADAETEVRFAQQAGLDELLDGEPRTGDPKQLGMAWIDHRAKRNVKVVASERDQARRDRENTKALAESRAQELKRTRAAAAARSEQQERAAAAARKEADARIEAEKTKRLEAERRTEAAEQRLRDQDEAEKQRLLQQAVDEKHRRLVRRRRARLVGAALVTAVVGVLVIVLTSFEYAGASIILTAVGFMVFGWEEMDKAKVSLRELAKALWLLAFTMIDVFSLIPS